ncbi:MAG: class I SAM-dependent methyltransferase [Candidatus Omnitrophica bacterium]|nr:class I SAM-dependent methyltransferase [Candidatus Omnitrophota bacterium]
MTTQSLSLSAEFISQNNLQKGPIRSKPWYAEAPQFLGCEASLLQKTAAKSGRGNQNPHFLAEQKKAYADIQSRFMNSKSISLLEKVRSQDSQGIHDLERSESWKDYVFLCIQGERNGFNRMDLYERIIKDVVRPMLKRKNKLTVLDYGCGSSLFTRMLAEDFGDRITTISADVCRWAVQFSLSRNRLYNPDAQGYLIEDVMSAFDLKNIDVILAYCVFEHLPNSTQQISGLMDALTPGGILVENYSGHPRETPHKSDTFSGYLQRDHNLKMIKDRMKLIFGKFPKLKKGHLEKDTSVRYWGISEESLSGAHQEIRQELKKDYCLWRRGLRMMKHIYSHLPLQLSQLVEKT